MDGALHILKIEHKIRMSIIIENFYHWSWNCSPNRVPPALGKTFNSILKISETSIFNNLIYKYLRINGISVFSLIGEL